MITNHYGHCPYRRITATEWRLVAWWHLHTLTVEKGWYCWFKSICIKLCFVLGFFQNTKIENLHCSTASESYAWVKSLVQENSGFHQSSLSLSFSLVFLFLPPQQLCSTETTTLWSHEKDGNKTKERQGMKQRADLIKAAVLMRRLGLMEVHSSVCRLFALKPTVTDEISWQQTN